MSAVSASFHHPHPKIQNPLSWSRLALTVKRSFQRVGPFELVHILVLLGSTCMQTSSDQLKTSAAAAESLDVLAVFMTATSGASSDSGIRFSCSSGCRSKQVLRDVRSNNSTQLSTLMLGQLRENGNMNLRRRHRPSLLSVYVHSDESPAESGPT
ncbi:hypothetical protein PLICRDRAFT_583438 [Plicaturopsis crispa FD-325 SS-3]|nr:hypothetical protein PLICRDRAFT_583438 [Plicaturopsis crispa FD-325 SS-3]